MNQETVLRFNLPKDAMDLVYARNGRAYSYILRELISLLSKNVSHAEILEKAKSLCQAYDVVIFDAPVVDDQC